MQTVIQDELLETGRGTGVYDVRSDSAAGKGPETAITVGWIIGEGAEDIEDGGMKPEAANSIILALSQAALHDPSRDGW